MGMKPWIISMVFGIMVISETILLNWINGEKIITRHRWSQLLLAAAGCVTFLASVSEISIRSLTLFFLLTTQTVLCFEDMEEKKVLSLFQYLLFFPFVILIIEKWATTGFLASDLLPIVFSLATVRTRGMADTESMILYSLCFTMYHIPYIVTIVAYLTGYLLQFLLQCGKAKKAEGVFWQNYQKKEPMAFLPALFLGFCFTWILYSVGYMSI